MQHISKRIDDEEPTSSHDLLDNLGTNRWEKLVITMATRDSPTFSAVSQALVRQRGRIRENQREQ